MMVTRKGFTQVVANAYAGYGFPAEGPSVYEFPMEMFDKGSDLTPLRENFDKIIYGLTKWQPKITTKGIVRPDMMTVQGKDYQDAVNNMNFMFLKNMWSDGLPLVPPTQDRVKWILTGTDLSPDSVIGNITPRGGIADVTSIAVALAMAGGRPEYMPVLIAAVEAMSDPKYLLSGANSTTHSNIPAVIVNGPIAKQIRLSSSYGLLGPDPVHPAGMVIGRAIRMILQDMGGGIPGVGTMAIFGGMRATNVVFAEDEEGLPKGWDSLAVDWGFPKGVNVVTVTPVNSNQNILIRFGTKETNDQTLVNIAKVMVSPALNLVNGPTLPAVRDANNRNLSTGVVLIARGYAVSLAEVSGYSKEKVRNFLWDHAKIPWSEAVAMGWSDRLAAAIPKGQDIPVTPVPRQIRLVVAGGDQSGHTYWMSGSSAYGSVIKEVRKLPANWDALLKQAEADLGPAPTR